MEILQARILKWVAYPFSRGTSWPRNRTGVSCIAGRFFMSWATEEAHLFAKTCYFSIHFKNVCHYLLKHLYTREYQTTWPASWEICMQVRKQKLERDMEQQTGSKSGKEYVKAVYCHPVYLTYMQSTSWEKSWAGGSTSWNQDCREKYQ